MNSGPQLPDLSPLAKIPFDTITKGCIIAGIALVLLTSLALFAVGKECRREIEDKFIL